MCPRFGADLSSLIADDSPIVIGIDQQLDFDTDAIVRAVEADRFTRRRGEPPLQRMATETDGIADGSPGATRFKTLNQWIASMTVGLITRGGRGGPRPGQRPGEALHQKS